jgi:hypothetical protein
VSSTTMSRGTKKMRSSVSELGRFIGTKRPQPQNASDTAPKRL